MIVQSGNTIHLADIVELMRQVLQKSCIGRRKLGESKSERAERLLFGGHGNTCLVVEGRAITTSLTSQTNRKQEGKKERK